MWSFAYWLKISATILEMFGMEKLKYGESFYKKIRK